MLLSQVCFKKAAHGVAAAAQEEVSCLPADGCLCFIAALSFHFLFSQCVAAVKRKAGWYSGGCVLARLPVQL